MKVLLITALFASCLSAASYAATCPSPENGTGEICKIDPQNFRVMTNDGTVKSIDATQRKSKNKDVAGFSALALKSKCGTLKFVLQPKNGIATLMNSAMIQRRNLCSDMAFNRIDTHNWYFHDLTR